MYKLYGSPRCSSLAPQAVLEEANAPYEFVNVDLDKKEHKTPEYLKLNPVGVVPTLVVDGQVMWEASAICTFLADRHPETKLAPPIESPLRGVYLQWMVYLSGTLQETYYRWWRTRQHVLRVEDIPNFIAHETDGVKRALTIIDRALEPTGFLVGDHLTCPDIYLFMIASWLTPRGVAGLPHQLKMVHPFKNIMKSIERVGAHPSVKRTWEINAQGWKPKTEEYFAASIEPPFE